MSLPFVLGARPNAASSKHRGGGGGGGHKSGQTCGQATHRNSLDAANPKVGSKRDSSQISEVIAGCSDFGFWSSGREHNTSAAAPLPRVAVVGLGELGVQLADALAGFPGVLQLSVYDDNVLTCQRYSVLPGVSVRKSLEDACSAADMIILCTEPGAMPVAFQPSIRRALKDKPLLHLTGGGPSGNEGFVQAALQAGALYVSGRMLVERGAHRGNIFSRPQVQIAVSGSRDGWQKLEPIIKTAAPASFHFGGHPGAAGALVTGLVTVMAFLDAGLEQATSTLRQFDVSGQWLTKLLAGNYMPALRQRIERFHSAALLPPASMSADVSASVTDTLCDTSGAPPGTSASAPAEGTLGWRAQLEEIMAVCELHKVDHSIIRGMLGASSRSAGAPLELPTRSSAAVIAADSCDSRQVAPPADWTCKMGDVVTEKNGLEDVDMLTPNDQFSLFLQEGFPLEHGTQAAYCLP